MPNLNKKFELNEFSDLFLIFYSIWIYLYNNNFSTKKSYLDNQFTLKYGIGIEEYLINNPSLEEEMKNELESKDLINSIFSLIHIQNSLDKKISNHLIENYNLEKTSTNLEKLTHHINKKLEKITLTTRLENKEKNKFSSIKTCNSLLGIAWINISEIISKNKLVKICTYIKCNMIFVSNRKSSAYCNAKCQTRAKSHRAYYGSSKKYNEDKLDGNSNAAINNKNNVDRLPPEEYKIPDEYEPDFGFFDGEDDKLKILGG
tara:strand:+ start:1849 stop:2628 length:780 start_codon:yes stop_codon:yes gene_type:complete